LQQLCCSSLLATFDTANIAIKWCKEKHPKLSRRLMATLITISVMLSNTIVDFLLVWYDKKLDRNRCPFFGYLEN